MRIERVERANSDDVDVRKWSYSSQRVCDMPRLYQVATREKNMQFIIQSLYPPIDTALNINQVSRTVQLYSAPLSLQYYFRTLY